MDQTIAPSAGRSRRRRHPHRTNTPVLVACTACTLLFSFTAAFAPSLDGISRATLPTLQRWDIRTHHMHSHDVSSTRLYNLFPKDEFDRDDFLDDDDDEFDGEKYDPAVAAQIRKAKQLLSDTRRKQEEKAKEAAKAAAAAAAQAEANAPSEKKEKGGIALPFFATRSFTSTAAQTSKKIKSKTRSGDIIADGETMAALSKSEAWERRSLGQMFQREKRVDFDGNLVEEENERVLNDRDLARNIFNLRKQLQDEDFKRVFDDRNRFIGEVD